jgi:hypothetical protein
MGGPARARHITDICVRVTRVAQMGGPARARHIIGSCPIGPCAADAAQARRPGSRAGPARLTCPGSH